MNRTFGRKLHTILMALCACALTVVAQGNATSPNSPAADEAAIRENVRQMEAGWNTKSGAAFAAPFTADADYVIINGMHIHGRAAIAEGHQRIFDTIFKESTMSLSVKQVRFLRPDVAVAHVNAALTLPPRESKAILTLIMVRDAGAWKIAAFQNTQVTAP